MPFSEDVVYIFDKQLEEAGLIVVNKMDLLSETALDELQGLVEARYPGQPYLLQSSLTPAGVQPWLDEIQVGLLALPETSLDIDYQRYGAGEAQLAWLDEAVDLRFAAGDGRRSLQEIIGRFSAALAKRGAGIGHLKFILQAGEISAKLSFSTLEEPDWPARIPDWPGDAASLLVNARVEMPAAELAALLRQALDGQDGVRYTIHDAQAFHPGQPKPTYRIE